MVPPPPPSRPHSALELATPPRPGRFRLACVVGLLAVLVRLVVISAPPPDLSYQGFVWTEEWLRGNIAHEVLSGPVVPLQDHQIPFWGGMLAIGLMAVPTFAILGESLFALRLTTLPFAFLLAACGFLLLDRLVSRRAAWIGGILLALTPPGWTYTSVLAQGTHCEQTALGLLLVWLYVEHRRSGTRSLRLAFVVGLVFGLHVSFGAAQILPMLLVFDFACDRRFFLRREYGVRILGMILGALPFLSYEIAYGGMAHENYGYGPLGMITPKGLGVMRDKLASLPFVDFPRSFWFGDGFGRTCGVAVTLALLAAFAGALYVRRGLVVDLFRAMLPWKRANPSLDPLSLVLVWPLAWLVLYALTPLALGPGEWVIDYRYLLPPQIYLFLAAAIALDALAPRSVAWRRASLAVPVAFGLSCAGSALARCDFAHMRERWKTPGSRPDGVARLVLWKHGTRPENLERFVGNVLAKRSGTEQDGLLYEFAKLLRVSLAQSMRNGREPKGDSDDPRRAIVWARDRVPARYRPYFEIQDSGPPQQLPPYSPMFWAQRGEVQPAEWQH
jgi:hypothetical protein